MRNRKCIDCGQGCNGLRCKPCENLNRKEDVSTRIITHSGVTETGCWQWTAYTNASGYGELGVDGKKVKAHRASYEAFRGPIPAGLTLDHLCRNRACVNPQHLEPVTRGENVMRGDTLPARQAAQTHCHRGHEFTPENTYRSTRRPNIRVCRACGRIDAQRRRYGVSA